MVEEAKHCLVSLRQRRPKLRVEVAGREVPIYTEDADAIQWLTTIIGSQPATQDVKLDRWLMVGGNAARNASMAGGIPLLNMRWRVSMTDDPVLENDLRQFQRLCIEQDAPILPAMHPLAVAGVLLMRTSQNLLAVDFATGKRLWEVPDELDNDGAPVVQIGDPRSQRSILAASLRQRMWSDTTYGTLSSDGRLVFAIEDLEQGPGQGQLGSIVVRAGPMGVNPAIGVMTDGDQGSLSNQLAAYDIRTGKLAWQLGGPAGSDALRQAETFFLGPPLPLLGQLYVLGEIKSEIRLMALDAATGSLLWSQQLAVAEQDVGQDIWRRTSGTSPSYADGVLVCPTSAGAIVGVDMATRSLLWGYQYGRRNVRRANALMVGTPAAPRWLDGNVSIVDGRVIATPVDSDLLYCLNLSDGEVVWQAPRQTDLYVACADRDKVVVVGRHALRALRMADGKPAWHGRIVRLPEKSMPSGRGFLAGERYYVPLTNAEVAAIDTTKGTIVHVAKSRKGDVAGNLVCYQGKMISQGFGGVDAYYQLDAANAEVQRRLAAKPDDAEALSLRGEILLDAEKPREAIACFRRAYELEPEPRTREMLRDSLMAGMQTDFAAYRDRASEVERLLDDPAQRAAYLRLMAEGLRKDGHWVDAFSYCQKLIDLEPAERPLDKISSTHSARCDRWLAAELALLRDEADKTAAAKIDSAIEQRLKDAIAAGSIAQLQLSLDYFGGQPVAAAARKVLVSRLTSAHRLLEAEIAGSSGPDQGTDVSWGDMARPLKSKQDNDWPVGKIVVTKPIATASPSPRYLIEMRGSAMPYLSELSARFDDNGRTIVGSDGWGREQWRIPLPTDPHRTNMGYNRA